MRHDLVYAVRSLIKSPMFAALAVCTLALGIGAAVGVFTVLDAVLLRPLPVRDADRLAIVSAEDVKVPGSIVGASWTKFEQLQARTRTLSGVAAFIEREFTVRAGDTPEQVPGERVTAGFFDVLGVPLALGRSFSQKEDVDGAAPVAIVTDAFWRRALGADPRIVGRTIRIDARDTTVVGVLPAGFRFQFTDREPEVYLTRVFSPDVMTVAQIRKGAGFLGYVGRLNAGVTFEQVRGELAAFDDRYRQEFATYTDAGKYRLHAVPMLESLVGNLRPALFVLMGAVLLLQLIACANVAHLMLARATGRRREVAVRLALGASTGQLIRQLLVESLVVAAAAGALGVFLARAAIAALVAHGPANIPRLADAAPDGRVLAFAVLLAAVTAVVFGIVPALRMRTTSLTDALTDGRGGGPSHGAGRLHRWIATSESAVTLVLLVAAVLLFESVLRLQAVDVGFDPQHVYSALLALPRDTYAAPEQREAFFTELLHDLQARPGIAAAGATSYLPMGGANYGFFFYVEGQPRLGPGRDPVTAVRHVSADYFRVMNIPLRRGRTFAESDAAGSEPVAIINETSAARFFANVDPVGRHLANSGDGIMREIVGVVGDVRYDGPAGARQQELYLPYRQIPWPSMTVVVSSALSPAVVASELRDAAARRDRDLAFAEIRPMPRVVAAATTQEQFTTSLLGGFALAATALAAVGLYGVIALFVGQRRHEFGIRMALGAQPGDLMKLVIREAAVVVGTGLGLGIVCAAALGRALSGILFGVSPLQPAGYLVAAAVLAGVGCVASYLPARRATMLPPVEALRAD